MLEVKALSHVLDPDTAVADNFALPSLAEMMMAVEYWLLHSESRCLNMIEGYLSVAELRIRIVEEEGD